MPPAQSNQPSFAKEEKVLCFHGELLYEAKILDSKPAIPEDKKSPWLYRVHYKGWKNTWDDWVNADRVRKLTEENKELAQNLKKDFDAARRPLPKQTTNVKRSKGGSDQSSARASEERHSSVPATGRGQKRGRDYELDRTRSQARKDAAASASASSSVAIKVKASGGAAAGKRKRGPQHDGETLDVEPESKRARSEYSAAESAKKRPVPRAGKKKAAPRGPKAAKEQVSEPAVAEEASRGGTRSSSVPASAVHKAGEVNTNSSRPAMRIVFVGRSAPFERASKKADATSANVDAFPMATIAEEGVGQARTHTQQGVKKRTKASQGGGSLHSLGALRSAAPLAAPQKHRPRGRVTPAVIDEEAAIARPVRDASSPPPSFFDNTRKRKRTDPRRFGKMTANEALAVSFEDEDEMEGSGLPTFLTNPLHDAVIQPPPKKRRASARVPSTTTTGPAGAAEARAPAEEEERAPHPKLAQLNRFDRTEDRRRFFYETHEYSEYSVSRPVETHHNWGAMEEGRYTMADWPRRRNGREAAPSGNADRDLGSEGEDSQARRRRGRKGRGGARRRRGAAGGNPDVNDGAGAVESLADEVFQEENFHTRPAVRIHCPDTIKAILVDDWENVTKNLTLVKLPCDKPVSKVIDEYAAEERPKRRPGSAEADILEEVISGLKEYFNISLGRILLYRFERQQYMEVRRLYDNAVGNEWEGKGAADVYGAEHLARLIVTMPELIAQTNMDHQAISRLREEMTKLTGWLARNASKMFVGDYEPPSSDYIEKARAI